jgi:hypothetical protein
LNRPVMLVSPKVYARLGSGVRARARGLGLGLRREG